MVLLSGKQDSWATDRDDEFMCDAAGYKPTHMFTLLCLGTIETVFFSLGFVELKKGIVLVYKLKCLIF